MKFLFYLSGFALFYAMIGYPLVLLILEKFIKRENDQDYTYRPFVSVIISAYNEEDVIEKSYKTSYKPTILPTR